MQSHNIVHIFAVACYLGLKIDDVAWCFQVNNPICNNKCSNDRIFFVQYNFADLAKLIGMYPELLENKYYVSYLVANSPFRLTNSSKKIIRKIIPSIQIHKFKNTSEMIFKMISKMTYPTFSKQKVCIIIDGSEIKFYKRINIPDKKYYYEHAHSIQCINLQENKSQSVTREKGKNILYSEGKLYFHIKSFKVLDEQNIWTSKISVLSLMSGETLHTINEITKKNV